MVVLDVSVVIVALPAVKTAFGFGEFELQWIVNAYTLSSAGFLLLGGRSTDHFSSRLVYCTGFLLFGGASLLAAAAPSGGSLIAARALQGLGTAILAPATLSILTRSFTDSARRSRAVATWSSVGAVGGTVGLLIGGVLMNLLGWRGIFAINVPVALFAIVAAFRYLDREQPARPALGSFDLAGAITVTLGLVLLVYGVGNITTYGWAALPTLLPLAGGVLLLGLFLVVEQRFAAAPLLPLGIFRERQFSVASSVVFLLGFAMLAMWYVLTLYFQQVLLLGPLETGLAYAPMALCLALGNQAAGKATTRYGLRPVLLFGTALSALGFLLLSRLPVQAAYLSDILLPLLVTAGGVGVAFATGMIAVTRDVAASERGLAAGLANTARTIGGSLGLAVLVAIAAHTTSVNSQLPLRESLNAGFQHAFLASALVLAAACAASLFVAKPPHKPLTTRSRS